MKAELNSVPGAEWVGIPISGNQKVALLNALNLYVEQNKSASNDLLYLSQDNAVNNYPYFGSQEKSKVK